MLLEQLEVFRVIEVEGLVVGDREANPIAAGGLPLEDLLGDERHQLGFVRDPQQQIEVDVTGDRLGQDPDGPLPLPIFRHRQQAQLTLRDIELWHVSQRAENRQLGRPPDCVFDVASMAVRAHVVEQDTRDLRRFAVGLESQRDGGRALRHVADIDHQHHRRLDNAGDVGGAAVRATAATIEEAHHPFDQRQVSPEGTLGEDLS